MNNLPTVTLNPFASVCLNDASFALTGGLPVGGITLLMETLMCNLTLVLGPGNHQITYTFTDVNGCTASATQFIFVNQPPIVSFNIPLSVCIGAPVNLLFSPSGGTF